jgi:hypothetical protein
MKPHDGGEQDDRACKVAALRHLASLPRLFQPTRRRLFRPFAQILAHWLFFPEEYEP